MNNLILEKALELVELLKSEIGDSATEPEKPFGVQLKNLEPGDRFDTEIGKFIVLDHDKECGWTKVIQDNFFESDVEFDDNSCDYTKSDLKEKFDGEIAEKYTELFGDALVEHEVHLKSVDMQSYDSFTCKVRPITFDEARQYNSLLVKADLDDWWWTCTPWSTEERGWKYSVTVVSASGNFNDDICGNGSGVRPFCILKSDIFVSCVEE